MTDFFIFDQIQNNFKLTDSEKQVLSFWKENDCFRKSIEHNKNNKTFTFYDGPPFATGLPHHGHILAGTIKDIITRFFHQKGFNVPRQFGWDTHGLPVEYEIDKTNNITCKSDVDKIGIKKYNELCRGIVMRYSSQWEETVNKMGRWIDFKNDYKTLDTPFMESVWWVFGELYKKNLVYEGYKVMPYSIACHTPLSNFEASTDCYKMCQDPSIVISFPVKNEKNTFFLVWTTTPWTLPSNMALCVNPNYSYVELFDTISGNTYILLEKTVPQYFSEKYEINQKFLGKDLIGKEYLPPYNYLSSSFRILADEFVSDESGTGIVHLAPAFGEDDYRVCLKEGIIQKEKLKLFIDDDGKFTQEVKEFQGMNIKEANKVITKNLKERNLCFKFETINHKYPHCWRSDTPLIYKAVPSWFVDVPKIKGKVLKHISKINWVPSYVGEKRFYNWVENAKEWSISRDRYWGTPIPIWESQDKEEIVVISSIEELEKLSGVRDIKDLHRDTIDSILIPSKKGKGMLKRIDSVFDCWFESGSMPYAQYHYPFENKEKFEKNFPADFIAEGLDQTRGWFYTLTVLSTALFDKPAFKNVIVNGLVLDENGVKLSKRSKNYTPPNTIIDKHGADALRLYLINSPLVKGEPLKFAEKGVENIAKNILLPFHNCYKYLIEQTRRLTLIDKVSFTGKNNNETDLDKWIISSLNSLILFVDSELQKYHLNTVPPKLISFIDTVSKWYIRLNKRRMKGEFGTEEANNSLSTLYEVLFKLSIILAPFTPFISEIIYNNLKKLQKEACLSVHYEKISCDQSKIDTELEDKIEKMKNVIDFGRNVRENVVNSLKIPISEAIILSKDDFKFYEEYIKEELNVNTLSYGKIDDYFFKKLVPNKKNIGMKYRENCELLYKLIEECNDTSTSSFGDFILEEEDLSTEFVMSDSFKEKYSFSGNGDLWVLLDNRLTQECLDKGMFREFKNRIQRLRKNSNLTPENRIEIYYTCSDKLKEFIQKNLVELQKDLQVKLFPKQESDNYFYSEKECEITWNVMNKESSIENYWLGIKLLN